MNLCSWCTDAKPYLTLLLETVQKIQSVQMQVLIISVKIQLKRLWLHYHEMSRNDMPRA